MFEEEEHIINQDYLDAPPFELWEEKVFKIPKASYLVHQDQPKAVSALLLKYVRDQFKLAYSVKQT